ncbi:aldo/keto reductase [uncultured Anaerococcus sp.]|uniref:aldo/keto reductase n=1 Tax=uncultured Anaerococcus sp. TaxID=293428 RepID=UPI00261AA483|nr:aldo/keto reductase [uncultured Anaerococcus sp.]
MKYFELNDGNKVPAVGFGTYKIRDEKEMDIAVSSALEAGYTYFDTAKFYKNEKLLGKYLNSHAKDRKDYQVATKVWPNAFGADNTKRSLDESLKDLGVDYLDVALLHWYGKNYKESWKVLKDYKDQGLIKSIAVSNFSIDQLTELLETGIEPSMDQLESHPHLQDKDTHDFLKENNILHQSWSSLARGNSGLIKEKILNELADKYGKSPAQIALRWNIERGVMVLVKSVHKRRIEENIDLFDFELSKEDMNAIESIDKKLRHSRDPEDKEWLEKAKNMDIE